MKRSLLSVLDLEIHDFFAYIKTIRYGYRDTLGRLHVLSPADSYNEKDGKYAFSSPEDVVADQCGWCWDVANLIAEYCEFHNIEHKNIFMEYDSEELHQTHTQVFLHFCEKWYEAPDNSSPCVFGASAYSDADTCIAAFVSTFVTYLKSVLKENYRDQNLLVKEFRCPISRGISDEQYLELLRNTT